MRPINWDQIKEIHFAGHEIGSHTHTHPHLTQLSDKRLESELSKSKQILKPFGMRTLAYPFGNYDDRVIKFAKKYYSSAKAYHDSDERVTYGINSGQEDELFALKTIPVENFKVLAGVQMRRWVDT